MYYQFFDAFELLPYYFIDMADIETETSSFIEVEEDQYVVIYSNRDVIELYEGSSGVHTFIEKYQFMTHQYEMFEEQHVESVVELFLVDVEDYLVYVYSEQACNTCEDIKDTVLLWLFTKPFDQVYFMNRDRVLGLEGVPQSLQYLNTDEPIILLMSNGKPTEEYYIGSEDVIGYIESVLDGPIEANLTDLDYDDFSEVTLDSYDLVTALEDNLSKSSKKTPCSTI